MQIQDLPLAGAKLITLPAFPDERGLFVKSFHDTTLKNAGIDFELKESYFSVSNKDVIRGLHFQTPPAQHAKIVFCPAGAILDLILDIRKDSPTYGQFHTEILSAENHCAYYIPEGFAHGFKSLTEGAITYYLVSSEYDKESDTGLRWDSIGYDWECPTPIMSVRDLSFGKLEDFGSPF
jgi:dTDP-4-dehydrorhamnose 3,5-epimerase/CDP-3, 6-dideoxy-D-glycero-D-glycero-4-hexulose-5-epimerase